MIEALQIYKYMLKFHPTIVGWLIASNKVEKLEDKLVPYTDKDPKSKYIKDFSGKVITTYPNGVKRISSTWGYDNSNFVEIQGCRDFSVLTKAGIDVFDIGNRSERYCLTSQLDDLLEHFYNKILDISIPDGYPRICGKSINYYLKWLNMQVEYIKRNNYEQEKTIGCCAGRAEQQYFNLCSDIRHNTKGHDHGCHQLLEPVPGFGGSIG